MTPIDQAYKVKVIASSLSPEGARLDTLQLRYPRMVHADFMTHRVFSRNASSSRAIPNASILTRDAVTFIPRFRRNKKGMQPGPHFDDEAQAEAEAIWLKAAEDCREASRALSALGVHKELVNRMLEWFGYIDVLVSATDWTNFDALRRHGAAQEEIRILAELIHDARARVVPHLLLPGEWHVPYVGRDDEWAIHGIVKEKGYAGLSQGAAEVISILQGNGFLPTEYGKMLTVASSAARACRLSYSKLDGTPTTLDDDMRRFLTLAQDNPKHASPLEHQARSLTRFDSPELQGNFKGFAQFRKFIPGERA